MTGTKVSTSKWIPYLVDSAGNRTRLFLENDYYTIPQMQEFFRNIHITHPHLVGKRIDFEETPAESPVRIFVPGD